MNGIVHNCSHPNDEDVHFRLSEEQVFLGIFSYIEHLFSKIKPRKTFCACALPSPTLITQSWRSTASPRAPR